MLADRYERLKDQRDHLFVVGKIKVVNYRFNVIFYFFGVKQLVIVGKS